MSALHSERLWTVEDYLAAEEAAPVKHEFVGGYVYSMAGPSRVHETIVFRTGRLIEEHVERAGLCQTWLTDIKVRVELETHTTIYYPDVVVTCDA